LEAEPDDTVGRQLEELHRAFRALEHPGEERLAPPRHSGHLPRNELLPSKEEAGAHHVECAPAFLDSDKVAAIGDEEPCRRSTRGRAVQ